MAPVPLIAVVLGVGPVQEAVFLGVLPMDFGGCRCVLSLRFISE